MIQNSFDCMISRARRCIHAGGHAFTDEYRRLFLNHKREFVLTIKYNASYTHVIACCIIPIFNKPFLADFVSSKNVYSCLNACIFDNMAWKCAWHISKFKLDIAECQ
jgi:hypothetical protein